MHIFAQTHWTIHFNRVKFTVRNYTSSTLIFKKINWDMESLSLDSQVACNLFLGVLNRKFMFTWKHVHELSEQLYSYLSKIEKIKMTFHWQVNKLLITHQWNNPQKCKEQTIDICNSIDESQMHFGKWKKQIKRLNKVQRFPNYLSLPLMLSLPHYSTFMTF